MSIGEWAAEVRGLAVAAMPEQLAHEVDIVRAGLGALHDKIQGTSNHTIIAGTARMFEGLITLDAGLVALADGAKQVAAGAAES